MIVTQNSGPIGNTITRRCCCPICCLRRIFCGCFRQTARFAPRRSVRLRYPQLPESPINRVERGDNIRSNESAAFRRDAMLGVASALMQRQQQSEPASVQERLGETQGNIVPDEFEGTAEILSEEDNDFEDMPEQLGSVDPDDNTAKPQPTYFPMMQPASLFSYTPSAWGSPVTDEERSVIESLA